MFASEEELKRISNLCRKVVELLDDLPWIDRDTLIVKAHERADWAKRLLESMPFPHLGMCNWLMGLDFYLATVGKGNPIAVLDGVAPVSQCESACAQFRCQAVSPDDLFAPQFDPEDSKWIDKIQDEYDGLEYPKTFRELTRFYIREKFGGDQAAAMKAAWINRKTFSKMMQDRPESKRMKGASKRTIMQLAVAFELTADELDEYLKSAGHAIDKGRGSPDGLFYVCIQNEVYNFYVINFLFARNGFTRFC